MTATTQPERFFKDKEIRLLEINGSTTWVKRVYTEHGIIYECSDHETVTTLDSIGAVYEWIQEHREAV